MNEVEVPLLKTRSLHTLLSSVTVSVGLTHGILQCHVEFSTETHPSHKEIRPHVKP